jgi:hypothetical protein
MNNPTAYTNRQRQTGLKRLLVLAGILDRADAAHRRRKEPAYDQTRVTHSCGTPACAGGHWDASPQGVAIGRRAGGSVYRTYGREVSVLPWTTVFALTDNEEYSIFGHRGCGGARTAKDAAEFIRAFVKRARA